MGQYSYNFANVGSDGNDNGAALGAVSEGDVITITDANTNQTIVSYAVQDLGPVGEGYESYNYPDYESGADIPGFVGWGPGPTLQVSPQTIASSSAAGTAGQICWDANYIYVCTDTNTWRRGADTAW